MRCAPSTRYFTRQPVPRELLERVFDNARFAPSGGNRQGWRVIVVTDRELRRTLRELYEQPWNDYMIKTGGRAALDAGEASGLSAGRLRMLRGADEFAHRFDEVPCTSSCCVEIEALAITDAELDRPSIVGGASVYPFVQNVLLGSAPRGAGGRVHDPAGAGRGTGPRAAADPRRDRGCRPHLGRLPRGSVADASCAATRSASSCSASATARRGERARPRLSAARAGR